MQSTESRFWLRFESGEQDGRRIPVPPGTSRVGRLEENEIVVSHSSVSGRHARLVREGERVELEDLGSTNGIRVNGERVERQHLTHGDRVLLGRVKLVFEDAQSRALSKAEREEGPAARSIPEGEPLLFEEALDPRVASAEASFGASSDETARLDPGPGSELESLRADLLARSQAGASKGAGALRIGILAVLLLGALGFAAWRFELLGGVIGSDLAGRELGGIPVPEIAGNRLGNPSFENSNPPAWASAESGSQSFQVGARHRRSGTAGMGVELEADQWSLATSAEFELPERRSLELRAWMQVEGGAEGRIGIEFLADEGPQFTAWAPARPAQPFAETVLAFDTLPGYRRGRVVVAGKAVAAGGGGTVAIDDVSVVLGAATGETTTTFDVYQLRVLGSPGSTVALLRSGRVLFSSIALSDWGPGGLNGWGGAAWAARKTERGFELAAIGRSDGASTAPKGTRCYAVSFGHRPLEHEELDRSASSDPRVVTVGPDGYREHALPFERAGATDLLVGGGINLIRFDFGTPLDASAQALAVDPAVGSADQASPAGEAALGSSISARSSKGTRFAVDFTGRRALGLQLNFQSERDSARQLAEQARAARTGGKPGAAIQLWTELLDAHPYDAKLIDEASRQRSELEQAGLARVESLRTELDRAAFFQLADLYRITLASTLAAADEFAGSGTERECDALAADIHARLRDLEKSGSSGRGVRLAGVLEALGTAQQPLLRARVTAEIEANERER